MPKERYFLPQEFTLDEEILIEGPEHHHLAVVMRGSIGDRVEIVNGKGSLVVAEIVHLEKKKAHLKIEQLSKTEKPKANIILAQALPRQNRLDFILEKGTELGMSELWLFPGRYSEKKEITNNQFERIKSMILAALKQCGRLYLPEIRMMPPLAKWPNPEIPFFYGSLSPQAPLFWKLLEKKNPFPNAIFCVGPESGFSDDEISTIESLGGTGAKLSSHILRTETAAISALSLISHFFESQTMTPL